MNDMVAVNVPPRLPIPAGFDDLGKWRVLVEAIFPNAKSPASILLALDYCRVRGLDIMKRPVNIVSVWNSELGKQVDTIWPAILEVEITASRSKQWAGMDPPIFGPMITETFEGRRKGKQGWETAKITVTFPEFVQVTVYRLINGQRYAFSEPVYWKEAYGRVGGTPLPNDMWQKRPRGQLIKVAKAFSLRAAFPEEGEVTAEEMAGQTLDAPPPPPAPTDNWRPPENIEGPGKPDGGGPDSGDMVAPPKDEQTAPEQTEVDPDTGEILEDPPGPHTVELGENEPWRDWCSRLLTFVRQETELAVVEQWVEKNKKTIETLVKDAPKIHTQLSAAIGRHRVALTERQKINTSDGDGAAKSH